MSYIDPRSKLYGHLDKLAALQAGKLSAPVNVEIDLSNRCSLGCEWCHFAYTHTRGPHANKGESIGGDLMDTELAFSIIDQLSACVVKSIAWTGGGEPTLHPAFNAIVEHAREKIEQGLYTNGTNIDPDRAALLKQAMTWVYISLDAADPESYKAAKRVDSFYKVCDGIYNLTHADGSATIGVGFLLNAGNYQDIPRMIELGQGMNVDYIQFRPTVLPGEKKNWMHACIDLLRFVDAPGVELDLSRFEMYRQWQGHRYTTCYWSAMQTVITPNGKVWTCVNKREFDGAEIGDLSKEPFALIWQRRKIAQVDADCRVMCRGHVPNLALNEMLADRKHRSFI
jgi:MoaA/NifB/PqqE/SkfB family radical SAM enzyme